MSAAALFGHSNTPGQLIDRSALVPAHTIRDLATQPGTRFYRLLTDDDGNLLDVTDLGRYPNSTRTRGGQPRPYPASIGVIVSAAALSGHSNAPGQPNDRTATLLHRLLTDENGNLLYVTETGRYPSRKLGMAIRFRDGVCTNPTCTRPAECCDLDHVIPAPKDPPPGST